MAAASFEISHFSGGMWSKAVQGRIDRPDYRFALNECLNWIVNEQGALVPRPGNRFAMTTRGGAPGRVVSFDFKQAAPYSIELTAGFMRFFAGPNLVMTNDAQAVIAISAANPAVVQVPSSWPSGTTVMFSGLGANNPLLQNRQFLTTFIDANNMSLQDALTGTNIDGSTLGAFVSGNISRVYELASPYVGNLWQTMRAVQADIPTSNSTTPGAVLLHNVIKPRVLQVTAPPTASAAATFSLAPAVFKDGPYFDPVPGGTLATPSGTSGNITITLSFAAYDTTRSYSVGDYVTSAAINYKSLSDANLNNTPVSSPLFWVPVGAADAIGPNGFTGSDIGRHIRLFSEPPIWDPAATYAATQVVTYGGTGNYLTGATYWRSLVGSNIANTPGLDLTKWQLLPSAPLWTWGRITGLSNIISRAAGTAFGDMTSGGGLAAAFDGVFSKASATSAFKVITVGAGGSRPGSGGGGAINPGDVFTLGSYIGKNFTGSPQQIAQAVIYPTSDLGVGEGSFSESSLSVTLNLRAKQTAPSGQSDGTILGTVTTLNTVSPITIISSDLVTAWNYVWIEEVTTAVSSASQPAGVVNNLFAQLSFVGPPGAGTSQGVTVQIVGDPLPYTASIHTWRTGLFSDTTGWPTCGTYHEGRLWLSGVIANRIDSSKSNDIFNFAPTNPDGSVSFNNGISYTFNAPDINPIFWMVPDAQGIVCGTQAGEWLVQATSQNVPLSPTTIQAHRVTTNQCANVEPRRTDLTLAVVQSYRRELLEYFADVFSGKFMAQDLAWSAKHLTATFMQEIAFQAETASMIWARCADGSLIAVTYKRDTLASSQEPKMKGWHRHTLGSGRTVESITMAATSDGLLPTLAMVTTDATGIRHVEMATKLSEETDTLASAFLLDDAVNPTSVLSSLVAGTGFPYGGLTLNGLWHLNGSTVTVFAGGLDCGDFAVTNGSLFVPYGDGVSAGSGSGLFTQAFAAALPLSQIVIGFDYNSDGQLVRPALPQDTGARTGPGMGKTRRQHRYAIQTVNSAGLSIGTDFTKLLPILFKDASGKAMAPLNTYSGVYRDELNDNYSYDSMIAFRRSRGLPAIIAAIGGYPHTQDL